MTEMEDSAFMGAIRRLEGMHRVDGQRVMILRTGSNFSQQRPGQTAIESASTRHPGEVLAFESAYLCGSTVLHTIPGALGCGVRERFRGLKALVQRHVEGQSRCR